MNGLILASIYNPRAITVLMLSIVVIGVCTLVSVPGSPVTPIAVDILPVYRSPAVQVLTFYGGMSATHVEKDISSRRFGLLTRKRSNPARNTLDGKADTGGHGRS